MIRSPVNARRRYRGLITFWLWAACACDTNEPMQVDPSQKAASTSKVLARVDDQPIGAAEVDASLQIELHDLALARYRLRAKRLDTLIAEQLKAGRPPMKRELRERVEILLEPPEPPRLEIPVQGAPIRGTEAAPVTLLEFIDFQSNQARRLQPVLQRTLETYPEQVRLVVRDLALPFHRDAQAAAEAAHCAGDQDAYWAYHDTLLLEQPNLSAQDLRRYAERLQLDTEVFGRCLDTARHAARVRADGVLASRIGVQRAPTLFANGLYLAPPVDYETLVGVIESELGQPPSNIAPSRRPDAGSPLPAASKTPKASATPSLPLPEVSLDRLPAPEAVLDIPRAAIERALANRSHLENALETCSGTFSGRRLLKIRNVESGDLYDRFGLQRDDVLMLVDDQWVTDEGNPLWRTLRIGDELTLLVMRKGRPHRYRYRIR